MVSCYREENEFLNKAKPKQMLTSSCYKAWELIRLK